VVVATTVLCATGCGGNGQSTLRPASRAAHTISWLWWAMLVGSAVVLGVVLVLLLTAVLRRRGDVPGRSRLGTPFVLVSGLVVPAIALAALFAATLVVLPKTSPAAATARGGEGLRVAVTGRQWFWDVDYPERGVHTANEIHLPVGETATIAVRTADVIHSLWIPELNRKIDMIPGQTNSIRVRPLRVGTFRGQCAEFCGLQHANMALYVVVEPPADFARWLAAQARPAAQPATERLQEGQQLLLGSSCVYCHRIAGTNATGRVGPDLTHVASRLSLAAGTIPNGKGYLAGWILDPQHVKPGNKMPGTDFTGAELQVLLDYLESLR
jgi:cytochrome c oxidase subunit 2